MNFKGFTNSSSLFPKTQKQMRKPKLNIPDLNTELSKDQELFYSFDTVLSPPPLSTTSYFISETTNPDPNVLRSTIYTVPNSSSSFDSINIPLGIVVTPFTGKGNIFELEKNDVLKCNQCESYVNLFTRVEGSTFYCNLCREKNKTNLPIDTNEDIFRHPVVEISKKIIKEENIENKFVDSSYFTKKVFETPTFIFVIDLTSPNLVEATVNSILEVLSDSSFKLLYKKMAILTVSKTIGLLKKKENLIYRLEISSVENLPFIPPDVFFDTEDFGLLSEYLEKLEPVTLTPLLDPLIDIICSLSKYSVGSKVVLFTQSNFSTQNEFTVSKLIESSCSLSIFTTKKNIGIENLAISTMGRVLIYTIDQLYKIKADLHNICTTKSVFGVKVSVKTSNAIRKNAIYANTQIENLNNTEFSQMDNISTICHTFFVDEHVSVREKIYFQFILEYFAYDGTFRTLLLNLRLDVSDKPSEIYSSVSVDTLFACLAKFIASDKKEASKKSKHVEELMCKFLAYYRKTCCKEISATQFVLPETSKLLPLLYQSLIKNKAFSSNLNEIELHKVINFGVEQSLRYFYPRLFTLTDYCIQQDLVKTKCLPLSIVNLDSSEIYVLENSQKIFLYFGKQVDESLKEALFNNNEENTILMNMVNEICGNYGYELPIVIVDEGKGGSEVEFLGFMVEDTLNGVPSYADYIYPSDDKFLIGNLIENVLFNHKQDNNHDMIGDSQLFNVYNNNCSEYSANVDSSIVDMEVQSFLDSDEHSNVTTTNDNPPVIKHSNVNPVTTTNDNPSVLKHSNVNPVTTTSDIPPVFDLLLEFDFIGDEYIVCSKNSSLLINLTVPVENFTPTEKTKKFLYSEKKYNLDFLIYTIYQSLRDYSISLFLQEKRDLTSSCISSFSKIDTFMNLSTQVTDTMIDTKKDGIINIVNKMKMYVYFLTVLSLKKMILNDLLYWNKFYKGSINCDLPKLFDLYTQIFIDFNKFNLVSNSIGSQILNIHRRITIGNEIIYIKDSDKYKKFNKVKEDNLYLSAINKLHILGDFTILFPNCFVDKIIDSFFLNLFEIN